MKADDLPCFLYAFEMRERRRPFPLNLAAEYGAVSIFKYCLQHSGVSISLSWTFCFAAWGGCVEIFHVALDGFMNCGPRRWPRALAMCSLQRPMCIAAARAHLPVVRYLHGRGFPLWSHVKVASDCLFAQGFRCSVGHSEMTQNCLYVPEAPHLARCQWGVMRYAELHGAPLPESAGWVFRERRERAREMLMCFHGAARLSKGEGEHAHLWGLIADVPVDLLYIILVAAELEMEETFKPKVP